jgi:hypothetical protein
MSEMSGVRIDWQLPLNENDIVNPAEGRLRIRFHEAQDFHASPHFPQRLGKNQRPAPRRHRANRW